MRQKTSSAVIFLPKSTWIAVYTAEKAYNKNDS